MDSFGARFGQRILELRMNGGDSQEEVALGAFGDGNAKSRISELETGKVARPQAKTINALCAYFNISPGELAEIRRPAPQPTSDTRLEALEHYANQLKRDLEETRAKLAEAEAPKDLTERAEVLEDRLADPEAALQEAEKIVADLQALLDPDGNELGGPLLTRARDALEHLDYPAAEAVFEEIEEREAPAVARAARAAYARGVVAELDIRWADAAAHFGRAADLNATAENLFQANYFYWLSGEYETALGYATRLVKLCRAEGEAGQEGLATALNQQGLQFMQMGMNARAEPLYVEALEIGKATIGTAHPDYATRLNNLANLYRDMGRFAEAEPLYLEALEIDKATIGTAHPNYAIRLNNLAELYRAMGRFADAEPLFLEARHATKATLGLAHPAYAIRLNSLAGLYREMGRVAEAEPLYLEALEIEKATLGPAHPHYATGLNNLAELYREMGRFAEAEPLYLEARDVTQAALGTAHPQYAGSFNNLALLYRDMGRVAEAVPLIEEALAIFKATLGEAHPNTQKCKASRDRIVGKAAGEGPAPGVAG